MGSSEEHISVKDTVGEHKTEDNVQKVDEKLDNDNHSAFLMWPRIGIIVNIPKEFEDGSKLKDELISGEFNPKGVWPLWNTEGNTGTVFVEFQKDLSGFSSSVSFEKAHEVNHRGKKNWLVEIGQNSELYAWVATEDDYNADDIIGENLRKIGELRPVYDVMAKEAQKTNKLVVRLKNVIKGQDTQLQRMKSEPEVTASSLQRMTDKNKSLQEMIRDIKMEGDFLLQGMRNKLVMVERALHDVSNKNKGLQECIKRMEVEQTCAKRHSDNICERLKRQLATQNRELDTLNEELEKRERQNQTGSLKLTEDIQQKLIQLEKRREARKAGDQLMGAENYMQDECDGKVLNDMDSLRKALRRVLDKVNSLQKSLLDKEEECANKDATIQALIVKDLKSSMHFVDAPQ